MAKAPLILLVIILLAAAFFRFYSLSSYMTFLGDEGRDMLIIKDLVQNGNIPFIGPASSVGNVYLGPLYYYMMGLIAFIFGLNPVYQAGMVAAVGVASVFLVYYLGKLLFNKWSGLMAAWLYAISPVTILYSKSSWNPNPAPFFTLLSILAFYRWSQTGKWFWVVLLGFAVSAAVQMHYLTLPLIPAFILLMIYEWHHLKKSLAFLIKNLVIFLTSFNLLMLPWWLFEFKHRFVNIKGILDIFFGERASVGGGVNLVEKFLNTLVNVLIGDYLTSGLLYLSLGVVVLLGWVGWRQRQQFNYLFLFTILLVGLVIVNLYKGQVYDHYVGYLAPILFLLFGAAFTVIGKFGRWGLLGLVMLLTVVNLSDNPIKHPGDNQLQRTEAISRYVIEKAEGKPFNFALIAKNNYDAAYQFYLGEYGHPPKVVPVEITEQLFVVCEDTECNPINHPKYEIAAFGMSKIESISEFSGVKVFKLIANPSGKPS